jgi:hypothetical protein
MRSALKALCPHLNMDCSLLPPCRAVADQHATLAMHTQLLPTSLTGLNPECLAHIMGWLPARYRLGACATSCSALQAAAVAATAELQCELPHNKQQAASLVAASHPDWNVSLGHSPV